MAQSAWQPTSWLQRVCQRCGWNDATNLAQSTARTWRYCVLQRWGAVIPYAHPYCLKMQPGRLHLQFLL
jgi:hypothetical protein